MHLEYSEKYMIISNEYFHNNMSTIHDIYFFPALEPVLDPVQYTATKASMLLVPIKGAKNLHQIALKDLQKEKQIQLEVKFLWTLLIQS